MKAILISLSHNVVVRPLTVMLRLIVMLSAAKHLVPGRFTYPFVAQPGDGYPITT